ncbi:MAG: alpha-L-fucosidase [Rikenellaceae bacterium]
MKKNLLIAAAAAISFAACSSSNNEEYTADWSSLSRHEIPQWLMDAKFGIYSHWGIESVLENYRDAEQKPTTMEAFELWTGDKFNAAEWAQLFKDAGAQFAGPVAQHCTGCVNWDSDITDWNSTQRGPKVDILGELAREIRKRDMKLMASFHGSHATWVWGQRSKSDRTYCQPAMRQDSIVRDDISWMDGIRDRISEASAKYELDMVWFDVGYGKTIGGDMRGYVKQGKFIPDGDKTPVGGLTEEIKAEILANHYNNGLKSGREVEAVYKSYDIPHNIAMRDIENGNLDGAQYDPWMTDINMIMQHPRYWTGWFYNDESPIKDANMLVDMLIDVTSKNGRMLLNAPPQADGSFAERVKKELLAIGDWLKVNGEGIYGSTPWSFYGEGPTYIKYPGHHGQGKNRGRDIAKFTSEDLRYTSKGRNIYAFVLAKPADRVSTFAALGSKYMLYPDEIKGVELLGSNKSIEWSHTPEGLRVTLPTGTPDSFAYCYKIIR